MTQCLKLLVCVLWIIGANVISARYTEADSVEEIDSEERSFKLQEIESKERSFESQEFDSEESSIKLQEIDRKDRSFESQEFDSEERSFRLQSQDADARDINKRASGSQSNQMKAFRDKALQMHNELRRKHGSPPLVLDDKLNREAQKHAEYEASRNIKEHSCGPCEEYSENLYYFAQTGPIEGVDAAERACNSWYGEIKSYNFQNPNFGNFLQWGHLTAMLWKGSRKMGIGIGYGSKRGSSGNPMTTAYVVARYWPAGNMKTVNEMKANVLPARG